MTSRRLLAALTIVSLVCTGSPALALPKLEALAFKAADVPVGTVFHFIKSQRDGTHATWNSVFVASQDRLESLKWDKGGEEATLVTAQMDWATFSVRHFDSWHLSRNGAPEKRATLDVAGDRLSMSLMSAPITLHHRPWHSFDFDFTSLNLTLPHLKDPQSGLAFWRTDFIYADPPSVAELGEVLLQFEANETRAGKAVRRYSIGGPGLEDTCGIWWADMRTGLLVEYEIPVGDEPGYADVRLKAAGSETMSAQQWEQFKRTAVGSD